MAFEAKILFDIFPALFSLLCSLIVCFPALLFATSGYLGPRGELRLCSFASSFPATNRPQHIGVGSLLQLVRLVDQKLFGKCVSFQNKTHSHCNNTIQLQGFHRDGFFSQLLFCILIYFQFQLTVLKTQFNLWLGFMDIYNTFMLGQEDFEGSSWTNQKYKMFWRSWERFGD